MARNVHTVNNVTSTERRITEKKALTHVKLSLPNENAHKLKFINEHRRVSKEKDYCSLRCLEKLRWGNSEFVDVASEALGVSRRMV